MTAYLVDLHPGRPQIATVTRRQARVLDELLRDGADNATIARRTGNTYYSVQAEINRMLAATGMPTRTALAVALLRHDLVLQVQAPHAGRRARRQETAA